jgi:hypothetical protein
MISRSIANPAPVETAGIKEPFSIYPNPATNVVVIQNLSIGNDKIVNTNTSIQVSDVNGRVVLRAGQIKSTEIINVSKLSPGVYFIQIETGKNLITKKIIVSH